jgi:hypothetical protein
MRTRQRELCVLKDLQLGQRRDGVLDLVFGASVASAWIYSLVILVFTKAIDHDAPNVAEHPRR